MIFWTVQSWVLLDHLLFFRLGTRLHTDLVEPGDHRSLLSSAHALGLWVFIGGSVGLLGVGMGLSSGVSDGPAVPLLGAGAAVIVFAQRRLSSWQQYWALHPLVLPLIQLREKRTTRWWPEHPPPQPYATNERRRSPGRFTEQGPAPRVKEFSDVLLVLLESFRSADTGILGSPHGATPHFDRWARKGLLWTHFYANGVQTNRALLSTLYGVHPRLSLTSTVAAPQGLPLLGLPMILREMGYYNAFWHGGDLSYQNLGTFLTKHGFDEVIGEPEIRAALPNATASTSWGIDDEHLYTEAVRRVEALKESGRPTFSVLLSLSHHHPWKVPKGHASPCFDSAPHRSHRRMLKTLHYADHCFGRFLDILSARGLLEDTLVVVLGDHGQASGIRRVGDITWGELHEEEVRVPLLVLGNGINPGKSSVIGSQVDVPGTVLHMLGAPNFASQGRSLLAACPNPSAFFTAPFGGGWLGLRQGSHKVVTRPDGRTFRLHNMEQDPHESRCMAKDAPELAASMVSDCLGRLERNRRFHTYRPSQ